MNSGSAQFFIKAKTRFRIHHFSYTNTHIASQIFSHTSKGTDLIYYSFSACIIPLKGEKSHSREDRFYGIRVNKRTFSPTCFTILPRLGNEGSPNEKKKCTQILSRGYSRFSAFTRRRMDPFRATYRVASPSANLPIRDCFRVRPDISRFAIVPEISRDSKTSESQLSKLELSSDPGPGSGDCF